MALLVKLVLTFGLLSLLAVGGGTAVLPEMQHLVTTQLDMTHDAFVRIYSIGQLSPGPNMLMVSVIGYQVAGAAGAVATLLAFLVPSSLLCFYVGRVWVRIGDRPWRRAVQNALEPISVGLMCSGVFAVAKSALIGPVTVCLAFATCAILLVTRTNAVIAILGAGAVGTVLSTVLGVH
eukprot:gene5958-6029_t